MSKEKMDKTRQELSNSNTGWDFRQVVMDLIQKRTGVKDHEVHIRRLPQVGLFIKGSTEEVCKGSNQRREKGI